MSDNCMYSDFAGVTSYKKGCRCPRCVGHRRSIKKKYNNTEKRKQYMKMYASDNREKINAKNAKYKKTKKGKITNRISCGRRRQKQKCPLSLGDREQIKLIYEECYRITQETGIPHHVDHIIPLALGGLHHPSNLQILTAEENLKKGCKLLQ